jgi:predicted nucleic acid-binding protein
MYVLDELERVMTEKLAFSRRLAFLSRKRIVWRATLLDPGTSRHMVPQDPEDSPILRAALDAGVDYLVTNDSHLLVLNPYESVRIISMADYHQLLIEQGLLS